jgi:hypothetical protein
MLSSQAIHTSPFAPSGTNELTAPWNQPDESRQGFECAICHTAGYEEYAGSGTYEEEDGTSMDEAQIAPTGDFTCCNRCRSQLMFQSADQDLRYELKRFQRAVVAISESSTKLREHLGTWGMDGGFEDVVDAASEMSDSLAGDESPSWINENEDEHPLQAKIRYEVLA